MFTQENMNMDDLEVTPLDGIQICLGPRMLSGAHRCCPSQLWSLGEGTQSSSGLRGASGSLGYAKMGLEKP